MCWHTISLNCYPLVDDVVFGSWGARAVEICFEEVIQSRDKILMDGIAFEVNLLFDGGGLIVRAADDSPIFLSTLDFTIDLEISRTPVYDVRRQENAAGCLFGSRIHTPSGVKLIEELAAGDVVLTPEGKAVRVVDVKLTQPVQLFHFPERISPIRVKRGAIALGRPERDLLVSHRQGLIIDNLIVDAGALVNDISVFRCESGTIPIEYYALVLDDGDAYVANGMPVLALGDRGRSSSLPRVAARRLLPQQIVRRLRSMAWHVLPNDQIDAPVKC